MSKLALGTVQFGLAYGVANKVGQVSKEEASQILRMARESGIDTLDTAIAYGQSERVLGELGVDNFKIVTKLPSLPNDLSSVESWIDNQIEGSLNRLHIKKVYGLLLHCSENLLDANGARVARSMKQLKSRGIVHKIGVSIYDPYELDLVSEVMEIDLIQAPLNLVDRRLKNSGWLKRLHDKGIEVHTRSTFLQGLLLMPRSEIPQKFEYWSTIWDEWHSTLAELQITAVSACLSYPLSIPEVDRVVIGVDSLHQLQQIAQSSVQETQVSCLNIQCDDQRLINPSNWNTL